MPPQFWKNTGPTSDGTATSEPFTANRRTWATPKSYSFKNSHTPGLTTLDIQVRGLYPEKTRYHGVTVVSNQLMLFAEDFPASPIPLLADAAALRTRATSGPISPESFATLDHDGSWRKTSQGYSQVTLDGSLERFSETWPRAGMTRNGTASRLPPSAPLTNATGCGSWPTPSSRDWKDTPGMAQEAFDRSGAFRNRIDQTARMVYAVERGMWPTPTAITDTGGAAMCKWGGSGARAKLRTMTTSQELNGALNPTWVEWLMGYPLEWTALKDWGTRSFRRLRNG